MRSHRRICSRQRGGPPCPALPPRPIVSTAVPLRPSSPRRLSLSRDTAQHSPSFFCPTNDSSYTRQVTRNTRMQSLLPPQKQSWLLQPSSPVALFLFSFPAKLPEIPCLSTFSPASPLPFSPELTPISVHLVKVSDDPRSLLNPAASCPSSSSSSWTDQLTSQLRPSLLICTFYMVSSAPRPPVLLSHLPLLASPTSEHPPGPTLYLSSACLHLLGGLIYSRGFKFMCLVIPNLHRLPGPLP